MLRTARSASVVSSTHPARRRLIRDVRCRYPLSQMNVKVTSVDSAPEELYAQAPFTARVLRQIPGPDRPDYLLAELSQPLTWHRDSAQVPVSHLVLCAR